VKWRCKDGREVRIQDMSTEHIQNALALLQRKGFVSVDEFHACGALMCSVHGEYAQMYAENALSSMSPYQAIDAFQHELEKRAAQ